MPDVAVNVLMYFVLPLWLLAGFAYYLCHRAAHIENSTEPKEFLHPFADVRRDGRSPSGRDFPGDQRADHRGYPLGVHTVCPKPT